MEKRQELLLELFKMLSITESDSEELLPLCEKLLDGDDDEKYNVLYLLAGYDVEIDGVKTDSPCSYGSHIGTADWKENWEDSCEMHVDALIDTKYDSEQTTLIRDEIENVIDDEDGVYDVLESMAMILSTNYEDSVVQFDTDSDQYLFTFVSDTARFEKVFNELFDGSGISLNWF